MKTPYDTLGVGRDATPEDIQKAYRKSAMKHHPDRGGLEEDFISVQKSFELLIDPRRREHYDKTGQDEAMAQENEHIGAIANLLFQIMDSDAMDSGVDVVETMRKVVKNKINANINEIRKAEAQIKRYKLELKRFKKKKGGKNLIAELITGKIQNTEMQIKGIQRAQLVHDQVLSVLSDYNYEVDQNFQLLKAYRTNSSTTGTL
jgi:DnaJ-class molecular chaperone